MHLVKLVNVLMPPMRERTPSCRRRRQKQSKLYHRLEHVTPCFSMSFGEFSRDAASLTLKLSSQGLGWAGSPPATGAIQQHDRWCQLSELSEEIEKCIVLGKM